MSLLPSFLPTLTICSSVSGPAAADPSTVKLDFPAGDIIDGKEKEMYTHMETFCTEYQRRQVILDEQERKKSASIQKKNLLSKELRENSCGN